MRRRPDPPVRPTSAGEASGTRLLQGLATDRADAVYVEALACAECQAERAAAADPEVFCPLHMDRVLGLSGGWALGAAGRRIG